MPAALVSPIAIILFFSAALSGRLEAQEVNGTLRLAGGAPAAGVLVVATPLTADSVLARTVTGPAGRFALRIPSRPARLRALRIGQRAVDLGVVEVAPGATARLDRTLRDDPIALATVTTRSTARCQLPAAAGIAVVTLFDEARKALQLTQLVPADGRPTVRIATTTRLVDARGATIGEPRVDIRSGTSLRPYQSLPPGLIRQIGYVTRESDGTVYRAPDAAILLSDEFAAEHCMRVVEGAGERRHLVGLSFRPVLTTGALVRIAGVLWIDRATFELQRLEFEYVGLPASLRRAGLGGSVEFTRLPGGVFFEDRWEIRMPRTSILQRTEIGASGVPSLLRTEVLDALQVISGEVLSLRLGEVLAYAGNTSLDTTAVASGGTEQQAAAEESFEQAGSLCAAGTFNPEPVATLYGTVFERPPERRAGADVSATWREQYSALPGHEFRWVERAVSTTSADDGFYAICGLPRARLLRVKATNGLRETPTVGARAPWESDRVRVDLRFGEAALPETGARRRAVRIVTGDGTPVPYAVVSIGSGSSRVADSLGVVILPQTSSDGIRIRARRIGFAAIDTVITRDALQREVRIHLAPLGQRLDAVTVTATATGPLERAGFYERVADAQRGAYVAEFITPEEITERGAARVSDLLRGRRFASVAVSKHESRTIVLGRAGCPMTVLVDGQRINLDLTLLEKAVPIDELVGGRSVAAIEIYASAANAPARLVPLTGGGSCGIIAIWTGAP